MTVRERIERARSSWKEGEDSVDKLIALAYSFGVEEGTRQTSDKYKAAINQMFERAASCRYHKIAKQVIGLKQSYIYMPHYANDMIEVFGDDDTKF